MEYIVVFCSNACMYIIFPEILKSLLGAHLVPGSHRNTADGKPAQQRARAPRLLPCAAAGHSQGRSSLLRAPALGWRQSPGRLSCLATKPGHQATLLPGHVPAGTAGGKAAPGAAPGAERRPDPGVPLLPRETGCQGVQPGPHLTLPWERDPGPHFSLLGSLFSDFFLLRKIPFQNE